MKVSGAHVLSLRHVPHHRIELSLTSLLNKVLGVFLERLIILVGRLRLYFLSLTQTVNGLAHVVLVQSGILKNARCRGVDSEQSQQQRFYAYELVAHLLRDVCGFLQHPR